VGLWMEGAHEDYTYLPIRVRGFGGGKKWAESVSKRPSGKTSHLRANKTSDEGRD